MERLVPLMVLTGPMNEMPPGLKATGAAAGVAAGVGVDNACVADGVVVAAPVVGCAVLLLVLVVEVLAAPEHAVIKIIIARVAVHTSTR